MPAALNSSPPPPAAPVLQVHDGTYTPADQFLKDPDSLCSTVTWKDEEDRVIWVYRIQVCVPAAVARCCMNALSKPKGRQRLLEREGGQQIRQALAQPEPPA
jgi:hypothetical protein